LTHAGGSLLERLKGLLERTYDMPAVVADIAPFVVGDDGYRRFYGEDVETSFAGSADRGARTLIRETHHGIRMSIYYPDALIRCLETHPPQNGVREANIDAFSTLIEELDHFLVIAERAVQMRPLSLFELELHANVSKYLVLSRFAAGRTGSIGGPRRAWLRYHLFEKGGWCDADTRVRERYREAARWARRFLDALGTLAPGERIAALRRFHRAGVPGKLRLIGERPA
jgi:hypothetical protein